MDYVNFIGKNECGPKIKEAMRPRYVYGYIRARNCYSGKYSETTSLQIKPQHWGVERQISMESVDLDYFNNDKKFIDANL